MSLIINSFFTKIGRPQTGLTPTIRIWEVTTTSNTLIVGSPDGTMSEIADGFYKFIFTTALGFDETKTYLIRTDGGPTLPGGERFHVTSNTESILSSPTVARIVDETWDEPAADHVTTGTTGEFLTTLIKFEKNRTRIDKVTKKLTIFDNDGTTPLHVFDLKDGTGNASIIEICERTPT